MAESVRHDPIIERLLGTSPQEGVAPALELPLPVRLTGLVGAGRDPGYTRLYSPDDLSSYVDIPTEKIREVEPERPEDVRYPEATSVWVDPDAELHWPESTGLPTFHARDIIFPHGGAGWMCRPPRTRW